MLHADVTGAAVVGRTNIGRWFLGGVLGQYHHQHCQLCCSACSYLTRTDEQGGTTLSCAVQAVVRAIRVKSAMCGQRAIFHPSDPLGMKNQLGRAPGGPSIVVSVTGDYTLVMRSL